MKRLYIIRHAKSSWDEAPLNDFDRPLNERGKRDAPRMGKRLKEKSIVPDLMLSSPAKRALNTCERIAEILQYPAENIRTDRELYHAEEESILRITKNLNDKHDCVFVFGHNPGITDFVNRLVNANINNVPTCGVVSCSIDVDSWKGITWGSGNVDFFDFPKNKN